LTFALVAASATALQADAYKVEILAEGLENPTGIMAGRWNTLYYSEIPEPGVPGGANKVSVLNLRSKKTRVISEGEPNPVNISVDYRDNVYWTCQTAGVILKYSRHGGKSVFLGDPTGADPVLYSPTGLDVDRNGDVVFTELIDPGTKGANMVSVSDGTNISTISDSEPAPTDIVIGFDGTAYWTCATAGVILKRSPAGVISLLLDGLENPTGIDLDLKGRKLYFTEIPTPGVGGDESGNTINEFNLRTMERIVIATGFPQPQDVTVTRDGTVYWTCQKAGVIARAKPVRAQKRWY
jgi:hypothetical protein